MQRPRYTPAGRSSKKFARLNGITMKHAGNKTNGIKRIYPFSEIAPEIKEQSAKTGKVCNAGCPPLREEKKFAKVK